MTTTITMKNRPPPKKREGAQAKSSSSPGSATLGKPRQQTRATKTSKSAVQQKTRQLAKRNWRVLKEVLCLSYHNAIFVAHGALWITAKYHDELIRIALLLFVMWLETRLHMVNLLHH